MSISQFSIRRVSLCKVPTRKVFIHKVSVCRSVCKVAFRELMKMCRLIHINNFELIKQAENTVRLMEIIVYYHSQSICRLIKSYVNEELTDIHEIPIIHNVVDKMTTRTGIRMTSSPIGT